MSKTSNFRIRVEPELHQEFLGVCKSEDKPAAQVMREFMKLYITQHKYSLQADLFIAEQPSKYTGR